MRGLPIFAFQKPLRRLPFPEKAEPDRGFF